MKKIVLVEDDAAVKDSTTLILIKSGYEVQVFDSGTEILNNNFEMPDLFILDKQLPGVDGLDLCSFLKQQQSTRHVPVIIISASPHMEKYIRQIGAIDFLEKPFKMQKLREVVAKHIG